MKISLKTSGDNYLVVKLIQTFTLKQESLTLCVKNKLKIWRKEKELKHFITKDIQ